ncbi:CBS domain-containing protein [Azonexus sp.]|jgi:CBS domain-containing protein|uniref:CBS domain-containing protein n=1 Tax=Azonexus sp. TaxID=1872668 RepID=UPI0035B0D38A
MTADPLAFSPEMEVLKAVHLLLEHRLSGAPVVDGDGRLLGFFSEKDGLKVALNASYYEQPGGPVGQYMTREVLTLTASSSMADAIELFVAHHYRCYPILDGGRLVGQLCRRDALMALEKLW